MKNSRGFGLPVLLIILGLVVAAGGAYFYFQNQYAPAHVGSVATSTPQTQTPPKTPSTSKPAATIDQSSLVTSSLTPTITGTASGVSEVYIDISDLAMEPAAGSQYLVHDSASIVSGRWSYTLRSSRVQKNHQYDKVISIENHQF